MIESFFSGLARLVVWLWNSAMTLYYLAGFFVVVGGLIFFICSVISIYWKRSLEKKAAAVAPVARTHVHIRNLNVTLELTDAQVQALLEGGGRVALPPSVDQGEGDLL